MANETDRYFDCLTVDVRAAYSTGLSATQCKALSCLQSLRTLQLRVQAIDSNARSCLQSWHYSAEGAMPAVAPEAAEVAEDVAEGGLGRLPLSVLQASQAEGPQLGEG